MTGHPSGSFLGELIECHRPVLDRALEAVRTRDYWTPYTEDLAAYGESAPADGEAAFGRLLGQPFELDQPGTDGRVEPGERSPYGIELGISYPHVDPSVLLPAMQAAMPAWRDAGPAARAAVCIEILARLHARSYEFMHAAMHTSGHSEVIAFQASAVHAQDRGLEAVAYAYFEQTRLPSFASWSKAQAGAQPLTTVKTFKAVPRGVSLLVGGRILTTWNAYAGLFASLATGNPVLVKPHPGAVLPLALSVRVARELLGEAGFSPDLVALSAERPGEELAKTLATRPEVRVIDYAGGSAFGNWLEANVRRARVYTQKSGINTLLIESTDDYRGLLTNLAFSLSVYSGQLCTGPQNLLIARDGIATNEGHKSIEALLADLSATIDELLADDEQACSLLGAIVDGEVLDRLERAMSGSLGEVALASRKVAHPEFAGAEVRTPAIVKLDAGKLEDRAIFLSEWFGPIFFAIAVDSAEQGIELLQQTVEEKGALAVGVYTTSPTLETTAETVCAEVGVSLSLNMTGGVFFTQSAVYSDLHGTGANPAANSSYCDGAFVSGRFHTAEVRRG